MCIRDRHAGTSAAVPEEPPMAEEPPLPDEPPIAEEPPAPDEPPCPLPPPVPPDMTPVVPPVAGSSPCEGLEHATERSSAPTIPILSTILHSIAAPEHE